MLKFLHIENIAVIEQADLELDEGLNILTGETGAGKSIIIDSINAVLGERTSKELIRGGCDSAQVSAVFGCLDSNSVSLLAGYGFSPDEDGNIIITKRLSNSGKGLIKINDRPVTASIVKEIGKSLINIHGQHDNQALLDPDTHYSYIDLIADNKQLLESYYQEFKKLNKIRKELEGLETDADEKFKKKEILEYQISEIEKAEIKPGELEKLKNKLEMSRAFESTITALNNAYLALKGDEDTNGAESLLALAQKNFASIEQNSFNECSDKLNDVISTVQDVAVTARNFLDDFEFSELDSDAINERINTIEKLLHKYGDNEQEVLNYLQSSRDSIESLLYSNNRIDELSGLLDESTANLIKIGDSLHNSRVKAAKMFENQVCSILEYLNMPKVKFIVDIKRGRYTKHGNDIIEFLISANEGESVKPLQKIASGGELSRVMLAIKSVLLDKDNVGTMIFDEIDTGISGYTAGKVGIQLKKVAKNRQVLCVTHLPQIASMADTHFNVTKQIKDERTFTEVVPLLYEQRIKEIARMMSGAELTENLYNSAKELIDRSSNYENI